MHRSLRNNAMIPAAGRVKGRSKSSQIQSAAVAIEAVPCIKGHRQEPRSCAAAQLQLHSKMSGAASTPVLSTAPRAPQSQRCQRPWQSQTLAAQTILLEAESPLRCKSNALRQAPRGCPCAAAGSMHMPQTPTCRRIERPSFAVRVSMGCPAAMLIRKHGAGVQHQRPVAAARWCMMQTCPDVHRGGWTIVVNNW